MRQKTLKKHLCLFVVIVVTVFSLRGQTVTEATAQEKTEYGYGGGDYGNRGTDYGQNGLYNSGDIVVEPNRGGSNRPTCPPYTPGGSGGYTPGGSGGYTPGGSGGNQRQPVLFAISRKLNATTTLRNDGIVTRNVGYMDYHYLGGRLMGSTRQINSHTFVHSWGGTTHKRGNTYFCSNGEYYVRQGNLIYHYR